MAVGFTQARRGKKGYAILTEVWNGTAWSVVPSPSLGTREFQYLNSISCVSRDWCVAVGQYYPGEVASNLTELWNGSSWSQVPAPGDANADQLNSVSCVTTSFCMAVGNGNGTIAETWNGSAWSIIPSPHAGKQPVFDQLVGVSCPSQRFCMLLDLFDDGTRQDMATFTWDGTAWSALPTPNPGPATKVLIRVSCDSAVSCTAVGDESQGQASTALVERWNGSSWSVMTTPAESPSDGLTGISCIGIQRCAAVGARVAIAGSRTVRTLAELSVDGPWTFSKTGNPSPSYSVLNDVSCGGSNTGGTYCVAVGYRSTSSGLVPLIESY